MDDIHLVRELVGRIANLEKWVKALGDLSGGAVRELKTELQSLNGRVHMLESFQTGQVMAATGEFDEEKAGEIRKQQSVVAQDDAGKDEEDPEEQGNLPDDIPF